MKKLITLCLLFFLGATQLHAQCPADNTWTSRTAADNNNWTSVTYCNGLFVAVKYTGTGNRVMTSSPPLVTPSVTIAANPSNSSTIGTAVTFTATPTYVGTTPAYQWKKNGDNVGTNSVYTPMQFL